MKKRSLTESLVLSALAYNETQPEVPGFDLHIIDDPKTDVQCYIRKRESSMLIAFRGSNSKKDWQTDLKFWKKTLPYGNISSPIQVHSGFIKAYRCPAVREQIHRLVSGGIQSIRIMGHSYGAALSVLCAVDLQYHFPKKDFEVYLFGCPRVGNRAFQKSYNRRVFKTFRVENGNDIVTKVPFAILGYRHVGIPIRIGAQRIPAVFSLEAHRPQGYFSNLFQRFPP